MIWAEVRMFLVIILLTLIESQIISASGEFYLWFKSASTINNYQFVNCRSQESQVSLPNKQQNNLLSSFKDKSHEKVLFQWVGMKSHYGSQCQFAAVAYKGCNLGLALFGTIGCQRMSCIQFIEDLTSFQNASHHKMN